MKESKEITHYLLLNEPHEVTSHHEKHPTIRLAALTGNRRSGLESQGKIISFENGRQYRFVLDTPIFVKNGKKTHMACEIIGKLHLGQSDSEYMFCFIDAHIICSKTHTPIQLKKSLAISVSLPGELNLEEKEIEEHQQPIRRVYANWHPLHRE